MTESTMTYTTTTKRYHINKQSVGVEEIHSGQTINNVETSYFTQLKYVT